MAGVLTSQGCPRGQILALENSGFFDQWPERKQKHYW